MPERISIKPALLDGGPRLVRKPVGGYLAADGEEVNQESYWLRRLNDGDVVLTDPQPAPDQAPSKSAIRAVK